MREEYYVLKHGWKYYIVPCGWALTFLPFPDNFVSFYRKSIARRVCAEMNAAYSTGYIDRALEN